MNVGELYEKLDGFTDDERQKYLLPLFQKLLTQFSANTLIKFQDDWNHEGKEYEEFKVAQNKAIRKCIDMELSEFGADVRKVCGKELLTKETEVPV